MDKIEVNSNYNSLIKEKNIKTKDIKNTKGSDSNEESNPAHKYLTKHIGGAVLATALAATTITGVVFSRRLSKVSSELEKEALKNKTLEESAKRLKLEIKNLSGLIGEDVIKLEEKIKGKIDGENLGYDVEHPPIVGKKPWDPNVHTLNYPTTLEKPGIRTNMSDLDIPTISPEGKFEFTIPKSNDMKIVKVEPKEFPEIHSHGTAISENYAESVKWDNDKIARDIMQNFYDGHGQTLDGVTLKFAPTYNGKYKVRIEGLSTYTVDKAAYIGESTKRGDENAAGNYGEGLKMAALKLLKDKGATRVKIGSSNWNLSYKLENGNLSDIKELSYDLEKVPTLDGNFVEFETDDKSLLESLRTNINRFYHSRNVHFKDPDFENEHFGIKLVPKGEKGALYIAGQRFEFNGNYDGLDNILYLKKKPPKNVLDPSRDRTSINVSQLKDIAGWLSHNCTTKEEKLKLIKILEDYGSKNMSDDIPTKNFLDRFISYSSCSYDNGFLDDKINFPENYIAYSSATQDVVSDLLSQGYKVFEGQFHDIGMRSINDLYGAVRAHVPITPTKVQEQKIKLLKEAIKALNLSEKYFSKAELDTKIYVFNRKNPAESKLYKTCNAEAIIDLCTSEGFWIDSEYLNNNSFTDILETALHEMCHKAGGDESSSFSYKLTDVNAEAITNIVNNKNTQNTLAAIKLLWDKL